MKTFNQESMILVTGGTGLVGSRLLFDLTNSGVAVRALKRSTSSLGLIHDLFHRHEHLLGQIEWIDGDINDLCSLDSAMEDVTEVYHCAGLVSFLPGDYKRMMKINTEGTANLINAALSHGVTGFCHVSSTAALGRTEENALITENVLWKTSKHNSAYSISKFCGEREVWRGMEEGLNAFIVNPSIVLGPGHSDSGSTALFGAVRKGLKFYPTGSSGFVDVRDVSRCLMLLMKKNTRAERFILNAENLSYREVLNLIAEGFGKPKPSIAAGNFLSEAGWRAEAFRKFFSKTPPMITKETARNGRRNWLYSNEKIKKELGLAFISVRESVRDTCKTMVERPGA